MSFHIPFSYRRRFLPKVDEQTDFSGGMIRDTPLHQMAANAAYTIQDFLIDQRGQLYRRGPFTKWSTITSLNTGNANGITLQKYPVASNSELVLELDSDGTLYKVTASGKTSLGSVTAAVRGNWAFYVNKTIFTPGDGTAGTPKKITYDGTTATLASLGGSPPSSTYCCVYKSRAVLANDQSTHANRVWFSPVPDIESTWDTTNGWIDCDNNVRALVPLRNVLLVFGQNSIERIIGDTPPPGSNMDRTTISNIGLSAGSSPQSAVAVWNDNAIFANATGVFMTNGVSPPVDLTAQGGIKSLWKSIAPTLAQTLSVGVYRNTVLVGSSATNMPGILCFDLFRRAWYIIGGGGSHVTLPGQFAAGTLSNVDELLFVDTAITKSPIQVSSVFNPSTSAYTEIDTSMVIRPRLTTRVYTGGGLSNLKRWSWAHITHDLRDPGSLNPTWTVTPYYGIEGSTALTAVTLGESTLADRKRIKTFSRSQGLQLDIQLTTGDTASEAQIYVIEIEGSEYPYSYEGA